jgi:DNA-directed RNA polymerase specialized sigma24 family protein
MVDDASVAPTAAVGSDFTTTHWSHVVAAGGSGASARAALEWLCRAYWEPLRRHAQRRGWRDSEDCVQDFWLQLITRGALTQVDQSRGRFRSWLMASLEHYLHDAYDRSHAQKRGGGLAHEALSSAQELSFSSNLDLAFDRAWAQTLLLRARSRLSNEHQDPGSRERFKALEPFLAVNGSAQDYAAVGERLAIGEGAVKVAVHRLRSRFRLSLRMEVAETLAAPNDAAIDAELGEPLAALTSPGENSGNQQTQVP